MLLENLQTRNFLKNPELIYQFFEAMKIPRKNVKIYPDASVDVKGGIDLSKVEFNTPHIPVRIRSCGYITASKKGGNNNLTTLEGFPEVTRGSVWVSGHSTLTSLNGAPKIVNGGFFATYCALQSVEGLPNQVRGLIELNSNNITSLANIHKHLKLIKHEGGGNPSARVGSINLIQNPVRSNILGLMLIKGVVEVIYSGRWHNPNEYVDGYKESPETTARRHALEQVQEKAELAFKILNKHLSSADRDINLCQEELLDNGLGSYAKI